MHPLGVGAAVRVHEHGKRRHPVVTARKDECRRKVSLADRMERDVEIHRRDLAEVDEIADRLVVRHDRAATLRRVHRTNGAHHGRPTDDSAVELEGRASPVLGAIPVDVHQRHLGRVVRTGDEHPVIAHVDHLADLQIVAGHGFAVDTEATGRTAVLNGDELAAVQARRAGDELDPVLVGHPMTLGAHAGVGIDIENGKRALVAGLHGEDETLARPRGVGEVLPLPRRIPRNGASLPIESDDGERNLGIGGAGAGIPDRARSLSRRDGCGNPPRVDRRHIDSFDEQSLRVGRPPEAASAAHLLAGDELRRPPRDRVTVLVDHAAIPSGIDDPKTVISDIRNRRPVGRQARVEAPRRGGEKFGRAGDEVSPSDLTTEREAGGGQITVGVERNDAAPALPRPFATSLFLRRQIGVVGAERRRIDNTALRCGVDVEHPEAVDRILGPGRAKERDPGTIGPDDDVAGSAEGEAPRDGIAAGIGLRAGHVGIMPHARASSAARGSTGETFGATRTGRCRRRSRASWRREDRLGRPGPKPGGRRGPGTPAPPGSQPVRRAHRIGGAPAAS